MKFNISNATEEIFNKAKEVELERVVDRIWLKDFTVWGNSPEEISNRLGWLDCIDVTNKSFGEIKSFVEEIRNEGFTTALLMGMGGSSLAPEVFRLTFEVKDRYLDLHVLDSTHPEIILDYEKKLDPDKTLYIVSTKSGGTVETMSFMKYFYNSVSKKIGEVKAASHFIAITDPGSGLEDTANKLNFRKIFLNDPDIGGRFSALSLFGIVPAALIGVDIQKLFEETQIMADECKQSELKKNSGANLGVIIGQLANEGVDKLTFITSPKLKYLGGWLEQLIAESTGKNGKGILPVDLEPPVKAEYYKSDRVFTYIKISGDSNFDDKIAEIKESGFPVIEIEFDNVYQLGAEFFRWEFATAAAGNIIGIQPFDQPNVESAKVAARAMVKEYQQKGKLPELNAVLEEDGIKFYGDINPKNSDEVMDVFLFDCQPGKNYITIQAYLNPNEKVWQHLQNLRMQLLEKYRVATTLGYGPRFLHSTGQLHKGDGGNGYFIQIISDAAADAPIPDEAGNKKSSISFGTLIRAQSLGDRQALIDNQRKVLTIDLGGKISEKITQLINSI